MKGKTQFSNSLTENEVTENEVTENEEYRGKCQKRTWEEYPHSKVAKRIGPEFSSQSRCFQEPRVHTSGLKQEPRAWGPISLSFSREDKACKGKAVAT